MKRTLTTTLGALLLAAAVAGCMPRAGRRPVPARRGRPQRRNSLDWAGTYEGVLPCADCPGIKTRLVLHNDGRFDLSTQYLDRQVAPQTASGRFSWNSAGSSITLDAAG